VVRDKNFDSPLMKFEGVDEARISPRFG